MKFRTESSRMIWLVALASEAAQVQALMVTFSTVFLVGCNYNHAAIGGGLLVSVVTFALSVGMRVWLVFFREPGGTGLVRTVLYFVVAIVMAPALSCA